MTSSTPDTGEFKSKRILVTGGTKGAGKAIAHRFLRGAGTVIITARPSPEAKTESYFMRQKVIRETLDRFKGIDIIVHNVGGSSAPSGGLSPSPMSSGSKPSMRTCSPLSGWIVDCCLP
jgi:NAD(P)-dependent dehydrogenase (short-subunit alcohol dehydrogenase family)